MKKFLLLSVLVACGGGGTGVIESPDNEQDDLVEDETGPDIDHDPIDGSRPGGSAVQITAFVTDEESDVLSVELFYSQATSTDWQSETMSLDAASGEFRATIPGMQVGSAEMRYYIWAMDEHFNESVDPIDADVDRLEAYTFGVSTN
jgi:hypothetical protein